jgi:hypothetical protein
MFGAKQSNRDTDSVVRLTPNIKLAAATWTILPALSARNVRVNPPLDLRNTLLVAEDHLHNHDDAANHNGGNGYQKRAQTENRIHKPIHSPSWPRQMIDSPITIFLVELTGIEPVASWLQTRRSPSWATAPTFSIQHLANRPNAEC